MPLYDPTCSQQGYVGYHGGFCQATCLPKLWEIIGKSYHARTDISSMKKENRTAHERNEKSAHVLFFEIKGRVTQVVTRPFLFRHIAVINVIAIDPKFT